MRWVALWAGLLLCLALQHTGYTVAALRDVESVLAATFTSGAVDFSLVPVEQAGSDRQLSVRVVPAPDSNPFRYYALAAVEGDVSVCARLPAQAYLDGVVVYEGAIADLHTITTTQLLPWTFVFLDAPPSGQCVLTIEYRAQQTRHQIEQGGYSDVERLEYVLGSDAPPAVAVTHLILGKVYFATDHTQSWIELYNPTADPIALEGWSVCFVEDCLRLRAVLIPAGEYAVIAADETIHTQVSLPLGVQPLVTERVWFATMLDPHQGQLALRNAAGVVVDQVAWGAEQGVAATAGEALARVPLTRDTDAAADWRVLQLPELSIDSVAPAVVAAGVTTTITYTARNATGLDDALQIDVYVFGADDTLYTLGLAVGNTGAYSFRMPAGLVGPVRFKVVATGPENVLLNRRVVTDSYPYIPVVY